MRLREKLDAWLAAREHPKAESRGRNTARLPELEALLTAIVEELEELRRALRRKADAYP